MAQAKKLLRAYTSTPTASVHPKFTFPEPCFVQNTSSGVMTFTCSAPDAYKALRTGATNGNLLNTLSRADLRTRFTTTASGTDGTLELSDSTDTGYNLNFAIGAVGYLDADTEITADATITGTLTTAVTKTATFTVTDSSDTARTPQDNYGEAKTLTYVIADVEGTMTMTSVTINNTLRDYNDGDKLLFTVEGQDGAVTASIAVATADLTSHNEITTLYVNTTGDESNEYQAGTQAQVTLTATESHTYKFSLDAVILFELDQVKLNSNEITPYLVSTLKHANGSTAKTFIIIQ